MKWMLLQLPLLFFASNANASHIVGGDFQLKHLTNNKYSVIFNLYFDKVNADPNAKDHIITAAIYTKRNNSLVEWFDLPLLKDVDLNYLNPACAGSAFEVELLVYQKDISFQLEKYKDTLGYYIVWERCCRNGGIINLDNSGATGAAFLLEFPALFYTQNTSPSFKPVSARVACMFNLFQSDFGATDEEGDSLAYELVTPTKGSSSQSNPSPFPQPGPYKLSEWYKIFSLQEITLGDLPMIINPSSGVIAFNSKLRGIFAFAILCKEFRKGKMIGKAIREYQLPIIGCVPNKKPSVFFIDQMNQFNIIAGTRTCKELGVMDDSNSFVKMSYSSNNTAFINSGNLLPIQIFTKNDTNKVSLCLDSCTIPGNGFGTIIVNDNVCPSQSDTLQFAISVVDTLKKPISYILQPPSTEISLLPEQEFSWNLTTQKALNTSSLSVTTDSESSLLASIVRTGEVGNKEYWRISVKISCDKAKNLNKPIYVRINANSCYSNHIEQIELQIRLAETLPTLEMIPNIFTPNGDGVNDTFPVNKFQSLSCDNLFQELKILNRWGGVVFSTNDLNVLWDAQNIPDGIYFYQVKYEKETLKSYVQVLR